MVYEIKITWVCHFAIGKTVDSRPTQKRVDTNSSHGFTENDPDYWDAMGSVGRKMITLNHRLYNKINQSYSVLLKMEKQAEGRILSGDPDGIVFAVSVPS
jgi:hypothetical protein